MIPRRYGDQGLLTKSGVGVEKLRDRNVFLAATIASCRVFSSHLS
jgi:hypothetical protein